VALFWSGILRSPSRELRMASHTSQAHARYEHHTRELTTKRRTSTVARNAMADGLELRCRVIVFGSRLRRDEVQPVRAGEIERIADQRRARIEGRIHLDRRQQLLSPSGTKNGHGAFNVPNVKPVAGEQETSPDGLVSLVLPNVGSGCSVQTMDRPAQIPNVQQTVLRNRRPHYATDFARSPEEPALRDVSQAVRADRVDQ
jgi:hypothetical protein